MKIPTQADIDDKLRGEDLNTWLDLWRAEQGTAKPGALKLIAAAIPFPIDQSLWVLDVGGGTGDAGRVIHSRVKPGLHLPPGADHDLAQRHSHGCHVRSRARKSR